MLSVVAALTADCMYVTMWCLQVVRNYVPRYLQNHVPRTLETMYHVPEARNHVPSRSETMYPVLSKPCAQYQ